MTRTARTALIALLVLIVASSATQLPARAQLDRTIRQQIEPAVVQIAHVAQTILDGVPEERLYRAGSGTVVTPDGLILSNQHVVATDAFRQILAVEQADLKRQGRTLEFEVLDRYVILMPGPFGTPVESYSAQVVAEDPRLDLAVLRIVGGPRGQPLSGALDLQYVTLGDSNQIQRGDELYLFGYPGELSDLYYSSAEVGSLTTEPGIAEGWAWFVLSGETVSPGSSGGAAVDASGRLVAIPTSVSSGQCRPAGDNNGDGVLDEADGCVPVGGNYAFLRPANLALPLLRQVDPDFFAGAPVSRTTPVGQQSLPATTPAPDSAVTAVPVPSTEPVELWRYDMGERPIPDLTPIIAGETVYAGTEEGKVAALDAESGAERWQFFSEEAKFDFLTLADGVIVFGGESIVHAIDAESGAERWSVATGEFNGDVTVANGAVFITRLGIHAFDLVSGAERWYVPLDDTQSARLAVAGGVVYAGASGAIYGLDAASGAQLWQFSIGDARFSRLAVADGLVYAGVGNAPRTTIHALDGLTGIERWQYTIEQPVISTPFVVAGVLYVTDEYRVYALDAASGAERWIFDVEEFRAVNFMAVDGDVIYVGGHEGDDGVVYGVETASGKWRWKFRIGEIIGTVPIAAPAVADGVVYVGGAAYNDPADGTIYAIDGARGTERWQFITDSPVPFPPVVVDGVIYVAFYDGMVRAIALPAPS